MVDVRQQRPEIPKELEKTETALELLGFSVPRKFPDLHTNESQQSPKEQCRVQ